MSIFTFTAAAQQGIDSIVPKLSTEASGADTTVQQPKPVQRQRRLVVKDTAVVDSSRIDSVATLASPPPAVSANAAKSPILVKQPIDSFYLKLLNNPFFKYKERPVYLVINERHPASKDEMFYLLSRGIPAPVE